MKTKLLLASAGSETESIESLQQGVRQVSESRIVFSERLSTGIMVHFENGTYVFFPSQFLYEQRNGPTNRIFYPDEDPGDHGADPWHTDPQHAA